MLEQPLLIAQLTGQEAGLHSHALHSKEHAQEVLQSTISQELSAQPMLQRPGPQVIGPWQVSTLQAISHDEDCVQSIPPAQE